MGNVDKQRGFFDQSHCFIGIRLVSGCAMEMRSGRAMLLRGARERQKLVITVELLEGSSLKDTRTSIRRRISDEGRSDGKRLLV